MISRLVGRHASLWFDLHFPNVAQLVKNLPAVQETQVQSLGWEDPLENSNPFQYSCLENSMDRGTY